MKLGEFLLQHSWIDDTALSEALSLQRYKRMKLGRILRDLGFMDQKKLNEALTLYLNPKTSLSVTELKDKMKATSSKQSRPSLQTHDILFLEEMADDLFFLSTSFDDVFLEKVEYLEKKRAHIFLIDTDVFIYLKKEVQSSPSEVRPALDIERRRSDDEKLKEKDPYAQLFHSSLKDAISRKASDIHFEPKDERLDIRFRIFGELTLWKTISKEHRDPFLSKIKSIVNLDLALSGKPQDSRAHFSSLRVDIRANATPLLDGDKIVLRLLLQDRDFSLKNSGLNSDARGVVLRAIEFSEGLILISGPTGSGKTTTLYSLLQELDQEKLNISTIENPVEYRFPKLNQIDIHAKSRFTFADSLRALMRQDPDVILVGEIRDEETAKLCLHAASTGHLVLSTVHANGAAEVLQRLRHLGIDELSLKSTLLLSAAQRLLPEICPHCSRPVLLEEKSHLGEGHFRLRNLEGCSKCSEGVLGRIPILEWITREELKRISAEGADPQVRVQTSLKDSALQLIREGKVDLQELKAFS